MGRVREESDPKSQLVLEICDISRRATACSHWRGRNPKRSPPFVDWYLVLRVEENAGLHVIRKQYRKLALQLHPDKNKHPKAAVAFKLVAEAYACLCDKTKRAELNMERQNNYCTECQRMQRTTCINGTPATDHAAKVLKGTFPTERLIRSLKSMQGFKEMRDKLAEEVRVVENCLRAFAASTKESNTSNPRKEHPVFNPADYLSQGYPHQRTRIHKISESFQYLRADSLPCFEQRKGTDSPIFESRSRTGAFKFKPSCFG